MDLSRIGIIGYGEVGKIFASGLKAKNGVTSMAAWDMKFKDEASGGVELSHAKQAGVQACASMQALCAASSFIISAVTASSTLAVAQEAAKHIRAGTVFLDLNSASPSTKQKCAALIDAAGGQYVEAGVMTSVPPYGIQVPMLLGGSLGENLASLLSKWELDAKAVSERIGVASAIKMCRSVMIKGLEALVIESYSTARFYGVEEEMIATLQETFPSIDWKQQGAYFFSRVVQHGKRRAEEMRESARTVQEAGFEPLMTSAIAAKQQWVADLATAGVFKAVPKDAAKERDWQAFADALLAFKLNAKI
ncbi:MAG: NAD(P)-dependent oxidoreductase [Burkholderiales bacterium]|nr:MAG: NAD(P)-dependent oxidoreductase [Burkholderiales bacterium]